MPQSLAEQLKSIQMSPKLGESLERAHQFAREQSHRAVLLEHLLLALTEDPDAAAVMQASSVDLLRLGTDVSGYLGRMLEDARVPAGVEPRPDGELLRVMQAAGQAAQQSRRRQIDGAIVLAAIVGDGKSPAAGLLKSHGLTFEEAIRALQKANATANAKARSQQYASPKTTAAPPAPSPCACCNAGTRRTGSAICSGSHAGGAPARRPVAAAVGG
jgi:neural Wiskott-Aldrich syndrome protein